MKKCVLFFFFSFPVLLFAQEIHFGISGGYGFPLIKYDIGTNLNYDSLSRSWQGVYGSSGQGATIACFAGYSSASGIGAEAEINYLSGKSHSNYSNVTYDSQHVFHNQLTQTVTSFRIAALLRYEAGQEKWKYYMKLGPVWGFRNENRMVANNLYVSSALHNESTRIITGNQAFGFMAIAGGRYRLNNWFSVFGEFFFCGINWTPSNGKVVRCTENGTDVLATLTIQQKENVFVDEIDYSRIYDTSQPAQWQKQTTPLSAGGFQFGVQFNLSVAKKTPQ